MADWKQTGLTVVGVALVIVVIYYLYKTIVGGYDDTLAKEPWLVQTTKGANETTLVSSQKIPQSSGGQYGMEFSYSMWMFISQWTDNSQWTGANAGLHHVLSKGDDQAALQAPGIWLAPKTNKLIIKMNTYNTEAPVETCGIDNIPVKKWVHVSVVVMNRYLDVYINGHLKKRCILRGLPRQNFGNVFINARGGFDGYMSRVRYFAYALPLWKIDQLVADGPSDAPPADLSVRPPYLDSRWWLTSNYPTG